MNSTINDCLSKMATLKLNELNEEKGLLKSTAGSSTWIEVTALSSDYDSDGVQSAPELGNIRLEGQSNEEFTQKTGRHWTCGKISKMKRKRHFDVYNCMTVKRKKSHNEIKEIVQGALEKPQISYEIGYDADDEYP